MRQVQIMEAQPVVNPIDQTEKHPDLSNRFSLIHTRSLIDLAEKQGFKVAQVKYPKGKNSAHALHTVRMDLPGYEGVKVNEYKPQVIMHNAHNGTSSIRLMAGVFRLVCSNGMIAGNATLNLRLRHVGINQTIVEEAFQIAAKQAAQMTGSVETMRQKQLSTEAQREFINQALVIRANASNLTEQETKSLLSSERNLYYFSRPIRVADQGAGLWEVFNRVQEHSVRNSGLIYTKESDGTTGRLHSLNAIQANTKLNQELWELAEKFAA
jgi:hypothetical protein